MATLPPKLPPDFDAIAARTGYKVESDGRVYTMENGKKSYIPPWIVWQNSDEGRDPNGGGLTAEGLRYRIPGSDPSSAWNFMYENGGPFTKHSQWDSEKGTYKGSIDWLNLITTIGAGGIIGAGIAGIGAGGATLGADVGASTTVPELGAAAGTGTASGLGGAAATGTGIGLGETGATTGLASSAGLPGAVVAPTVGDLALSGSAIPGVGGTTSTVGSLLKNGSTLSKIADLAGLGGTAVADATKSAGDTQLQKALIGLTANNQNQQAIQAANNTNISGQNAFESQLLGRSKDEESQRQQALKDVYRNSSAQNPRVSMYNPSGPPSYSPEYLSTLSGLGAQGSKTLANPAQYATAAQPALKPYTPYTPTPYDPNTMSGPGGTQPSTMQEIGNWLGPTLSTISAISKIFGGR